MNLYDIFHKIEHILGIHSFFKNVSTEGSDVIKSDICNDCGKVDNKHKMMSLKEFNFLYLNDDQETSSKNGQS